MIFSAVNTILLRPLWQFPMLATPEYAAEIWEPESLTSDENQRNPLLLTEVTVQASRATSRQPDAFHGEDRRPLSVEAPEGVVSKLHRPNTPFHETDY